MFKSAALNTANTFTANGAISNKNIDDARVDLFYKTCRGLSEEDLHELMDNSWKKDPLDTLKLMAYTRDIRGGKGERDIFKMMLVWLAKQDQGNLLLNLEQFIDYGRYDDVVVLVETKLSDEIIELFRNVLVSDLDKMERGESVSLLAKWFPSENKKLDKRYKIYNKLAKKMKKTNRELRKQYITPLREYICIVETLLCNKDYEKIDFSKLPSYAMKKYNKLFTNNDKIKDLFSKYKESLQRGETKINAGILFPHEIVGKYLGGSEYDVILEKQWEEVTKNIKLDNCLVLSDVSGSMSGIPMQVSIALGILVSSNIKNEAFKNLVLTFETQSKFHHITGQTLHDKVKSLENASWGGSTDLVNAMKQIIQVAVNNNIKSEDMPKNLLIISDMQFNQADSNYYTNHVSIKKMFSDLGYQTPNLIYWNVNGSFSDVPSSSASEKGVSLVSGFSKSVLSCIMQGDIPTPYTTMRFAIDNERYSKLKYDSFCKSDTSGVSNNWNSGVETDNWNSGVKRIIGIAASGYF